MSQYIAGLAGNEAIFFFLLGIILVLIEIFLLPGTFVFATCGLTLILGSLLWAMVDIWPSEPITLSTSLLAVPMMNLVSGMTIAAVGALVLSRFFPGSWLERSFVLSETVGRDRQSQRDQREKFLPLVGSQGHAVTDLFPSGQVEITGQRYSALASLGAIDRGTKIRVQKVTNFSLVVEPILSKD